MRAAAAVVTRPREGPGSGDTENRHQGSRCQHPAKWQLTPVSDPTEAHRPLDNGKRAGTAGLTSGVRSGGFFFSACLALGSTGEFMAAAPAPVLTGLPLPAHVTAHLHLGTGSAPPTPGKGDSGQPREPG